jgi:hypothetical protein
MSTTSANEEYFYIIIKNPLLRQGDIKTRGHFLCLVLHYGEKKEKKIILSIWYHGYKYQ